MTCFRAARRRRVAWLFAPVLCCSACASVPNLGPAPAPRAASDFAATSLTGPAKLWPGQGWWQRYGDPQLARLIDEALAGSPDLASASARLRTAQGFAQAAGAALLPAVDASASAELSKQSRNGFIPAQLIPKGWQDSGSLGLGLSFDPDFWGKNRAAARAAKSDAAAARYELEEARLVLTTGIASTYAQLADLYAQRDTQMRALELRSETAKLVAGRVVVGLDNEAASNQAAARVQQTRADIAAVDEAITLTGNALAALLGAGPDRAQSIGRPVLAELRTQDVPQDASIALIGRRPDIAAARARVEAAADRIKEAKAAFYPDVSLTALIGLQATGIGSLFSSGSTVGSVSPAVTLPIFRGGALQGQYRGRRGQYDEAVAGYDGRVVEALRQVADAMTSLDRLAPRLTESRAALANFEAANSLARQRYEHGLATYLDVLSAEEGVLGARLTVAQLQTRAFTLDVALIRALGGGFAA